MTRIIPNVERGLCWYSDPVCGARSVDRHIWFSDQCSDIQSVFLYDKVTGVLQHACSGAKLCLRSDRYVILSETNCNSDPIWYQENTRFTRTSCKY